MKQVKVLIIDDNESLVDMVKEYFKGNENVSIALEAYDGLEGYRMIKEGKEFYDVVILDLIMPKKDGLYVLKTMKEEGIEAKVIVATSYNDPKVIREVSQLGVSYFVLKPFDLDDLEKRIIEAYNYGETDGKSINLKHSNFQITVSNILHELGVPSHVKGYQYIREAISMIYEKDGVVGSITKDLYPALADIYNTTSSRVERAIRHAIEISWNRGDWDLMEEIFGHSIDIDRAKPTNSEFIVTIADKLRLEGDKIGI